MHARNQAEVPSAYIKASAYEVIAQRSLRSAQERNNVHE